MVWVKNTPNTPASDESPDSNNPHQVNQLKISPADTGKDTGEDVTSEPDLDPIEKEQTIPKSIRLWKSAFDALKVLMGKYGKNMAEMVSICILAYAKKAAAAPVVYHRTLEDKTLFALQAAATDIKVGLSNLRNDLYEARKSHRNPEQLKAIYTELSAKYQALLKRSDETLKLIDKECLLHDLIDHSDHRLLMQLLDRLNLAKPKNRSEMQIWDLHFKIYTTLLR